MGEEKKAFGGAKVIYIAHPIQKESAQSEPLFEDEISRPFDLDRGDLIVYYSTLTGRNSYHARCLRVKAECTIGLGVKILEGDEKKILERLAVVNDQGQSFLEVLGRVAIDFETTGNGYLEVVRNRSGQVAELYHCPATTITHRRRGSSEKPFVYRNDTDKVEFAAFKEGDREENALLHFANITQESRYYGLPDWRGAVPDIELDYYATLYSKNFFINSGVPDLAIVVEGGEFDPETEKKVQEFFQTNLKGIENAHKTLYLPINDQDITVKFEKLEPSRQWVYPNEKLRNNCRDNIVSAHGVPPRLVGIVAAGQLGGGGEIHGQLKIFKEVTIEPRQSLFELKLSPIIEEMIPGARIAFNELDTSIQEKASELYPALISAGVMGVDEARERLGLPPMNYIEGEVVEKGLLPQMRLVRVLEDIRRGL
jgi:PBSX family phage portal protein